MSEAMESTGLDMLLDVHGDEEIPANVSEAHSAPHTAQCVGHSNRAAGLSQHLPCLSRTGAPTVSPALFWGRAACAALAVWGAAHWLCCMLMDQLVQGTHMVGQ